VLVVPVLVDGRLPPGQWAATWEEVVATFGTTPWRQHLLDGCRRALAALRAAGCRRAWIDGSFVTAKAHPEDIDGCYDPIGMDRAQLHPALCDLSPGRPLQKPSSAASSFPTSSRPDPAFLRGVLPTRPRRRPQRDRRHRPGGRRSV